MDALKIYSNSKISLSNEYSERVVFYNIYNQNTSTNKDQIDFFKTRLSSIIDKLSLAERSSIIIYYNTDLTMEEVGKILNIHKSTVSRNINRGLKKVKNILQETA